MCDSSKPNTKVLFRTVDVDGCIHVETPWATSLGDDQYEIDNSLWYAYGVSWKDVVYAPFDHGDECAVFQHVVKKGGHRTVRVAFSDPVSPGGKAERTLEGLVAMGCSYEGAWSKLFSVDVPSEVDLGRVRSFLIAESVDWEFADPDYSSLFPSA